MKQLTRTELTKIQTLLPEALVRDLPLVWWIKDHRGRFLAISPNIEDQTGVPASKWIGRTIRQVFPPIGKNGHGALDKAVLTENAGVGTITEMPDPTGEVAFCVVREFPIHYGRRNLIGGWAFPVLGTRAVQHFSAEV
jgi:PAS domain S-box-containing protein